MEELRDVAIVHFKDKDEYEFCVHIESLNSRLRAIKSILFKHCLRIRGNDWMAENIANHILDSLKEH